MIRNLIVLGCAGLLGIGGVALALIIALAGMKVLRLLPESLADPNDGQAVRA